MVSSPLLSIHQFFPFRETRTSNPSRITFPAYGIFRQIEDEEECSSIASSYPSQASSKEIRCASLLGSHSSPHIPHTKNICFLFYDIKRNDQLSPKLPHKYVENIVFDPKTLHYMCTLFKIVITFYRQIIQTLLFAVNSTPLYPTPLNSTGRESTKLDYTIHYYALLDSTILYYTILYCTILYYTILNYTWLSLALIWSNRNWYLWQIPRPPTILYILNIILNTLFQFLNLLWIIYLFFVFWGMIFSSASLMLLPLSIPSLIFSYRIASLSSIPTVYIIINPFFLLSSIAY